MDRISLQQRIDAVPWYHEFDFGNGLRAESRTSDVELHRAIWAFIQGELDAVDFRGKTVLDIGCWDGYWSFYAERRGARSVLATDDQTQNWADGNGLLLARELFQSSIEVNQAVSVYELTRLNRRFDIILCLGVYYHLVDPFYAFAQIRHCCHEDAVLLLEGDGAWGVHSNTIIFNPPDASPGPLTNPTEHALRLLLECSYFTVEHQAWRAAPPARLPWSRRLKMCRHALRGSYLDVAIEGLRGDRLFTRCRPFQGPNHRHLYRPPFGLHVYDDRYRER